MCETLFRTFRFTIRPILLIELRVVGVRNVTLPLSLSLKTTYKIRLIIGIGRVYDGYEFVNNKIAITKIYI